MEQLESFALCEEKTERVWVIVRAEIIDDCLKISGHDLGDAPKEFLGGDEFEYWYNFDKINTKLFLELLPGEEHGIKKMLYENFNGLDGCKKLEKFCKTNNIEYKYMSWVSGF